MRHSRQAYLMRHSRPGQHPRISGQKLPPGNDWRPNSPARRPDKGGAVCRKGSRTSKPVPYEENEPPNSPCNKTPRRRTRSLTPSSTRGEGLPAFCPGQGEKPHGRTVCFRLTSPCQNVVRIDCLIKMGKISWSNQAILGLREALERGLPRALY